METTPNAASGWKFITIGFAVVAENAGEAKEIMDAYDNIIETDAIEGKGLFANITDIPLEDEDEDDFDMVEAYNCQATFTNYFAELKQYGIIGPLGAKAFLNKDMKTLLMASLKHLATFIKDNTDKQNATKNEITNKIGMLDAMPVWGLFLQILILQGLCRWLESVDINEGQRGYDEGCELYDWLIKRLLDKLIRLIYFQFGDNDKKRLKPLCDYLYSTKWGRYVQEYIFGNSVGAEELPPAPSQLQRPTIGRKRGRPVKPFDDIIVGSDIDAVKAKLHSLIDTKTNKGAIIYITAAVSLGIIQKPTYSQFEKEFGDKASRQNYNKYLDARSFTDEEMTGAKAAINAL